MQPDNFWKLLVNANKVTWLEPACDQTETQAIQPAVAVDETMRGSAYLTPQLSFIAQNWSPTATLERNRQNH